MIANRVAYKREEKELINKNIEANRTLYKRFTYCTVWREDGQITQALSICNKTYAILVMLM